MVEMSSPLVMPDQLAKVLDDPRVVILDATQGANPNDPHIPGAFHADIEGAWSDPSSPWPHQRPRIEVLEGELRRLGVNSDSWIVVYEQGELFAAPRFWWLLRAFGFERVSILQGGPTGWAATGQALETMPTPLPEMGNVSLSLRPGMFVDEDDVRKHVENKDRVIIDARSRGRFTGEEPEFRAGLRSGHIPGAQNMPYKDVQQDCALLPVDELRELFDPITDERPIVTSCGSGMTACVLALALHVLGRDDVSVYDGSWTQWGREDGPEIETGPAADI